MGNVQDKMYVSRRALEGRGLACSSVATAEQENLAGEEYSASQEHLDTHFQEKICARI